MYLFNEGIPAPQVLVLDSEGKNVGTMATAAAIRLAREQEMDLVEINPKAEPPVARIMDFGQFKYQQEKEDRVRKAHQHVIKIKCVRLSLRIGANDRDIRKTQTVRFLNEGNKVKVEIVLRGRENQQVPLAMEMAKKFLEEIGAALPVRFDQPLEKQGNIISATIAKS